MAPSLPGHVEIPNKLLIEEIKKYPLLYDRNEPGYSSQEKKREAWQQICRNVFPEQWPKWSKSERVESIASILKRWGNLRTCFGRCYKQFLTKKKQGLAQDDKIRYRHFKKMSFLIPFLTVRLDSGTNESLVYAAQEMQSDDETQDWSADNDEQYLEDDSTNEDEHVDDEEVVQTPAKKIKKEYSEEIPIDPLNVIRSPREALSKEYKEGGTDQDMNFAMSLVPMFRELPLAKKLQAQIEILQVFQNITKGDNK